MSRKKILLVGPLPPPSGGVSVHMQRLSNVLKRDFDVDLIDEAKSIKNEFYNLRSLRFFEYFKKIRKADLIHIHSGTSFLRIIHLLAGRLFGKKMVLTLHYYPTRKTKFLRFIDELFYQIANKIIVVNANILRHITLPRNKCIINNAFLPPVMEEEPHLPTEVMKWIHDAKNSRKVIICANAWRLDMFNKHDLYGLDLCIEITRRLLAEKFDVGFIFNVATIDRSVELYAKYQALIKELDLQRHFFLISERLSFVRLIEQADIILRPTNWDGDSLTVREALMLGKQILASDIVERPAGTALFKTRDIADMELKLQQLINLASSNNTPGVNSNIHAYGDFYIDLAEKLLAIEPVKSDQTAKQYQGTSW